MLNKKNFIIVSIALATLLGLVVVIKKHHLANIDTAPTEKTIQKVKTSSKNKQFHMVVFEDRELFFKSVADYPKQQKKKRVNIAGGIVPHHLLPSFIIADFFSQLSNQDIKTLILVGPNHYERGDFGTITSQYSWETPLGKLEPDIEIINELGDKGLIKTDENVIALDHSMTSILPFIQYYLPETKIVPLILSRKLTKSNVDILSEGLKEYTKESGTVLVASVDFSHYLTNFEAKERNEQSLKAIQERNYDKIFNFENEYMDSPASVALVLKNMDAIEAKKMTVLHDTNSGEMLGDNFSQITSYLSLFFTTEK